MVSKDQREDNNKNLQQTLLTWAKSNLRDYPWRKTGISAYNILIAELLLKRTTATAAARVYNPFIVKYPTIYQLAHAGVEELASTLESIGLSRQRGRAMKELARTLVQYYEGQVPSILEQLQSLPSIGDYTARAIMSFGHDIPLAVVDGNVERVLRRVFQDQLVGNPNRVTIQNMVDDLLPINEHRNFNFALLDLGSLICRPALPSCYKCPIQEFCDYARSPSNISPNRGLRVLRQAGQLSQLVLARKAKVTKLTIINIEAGRTIPREETLKKIAQVLNIPVKELKKEILTKPIT